MESVKEKQNKFFESFKGKFGYKNKMNSPKLLKVIVNAGTGSALKRDKTRNEIVSERIAKITGQKPAIKMAKKSIAGFKLREGEAVGQQVTLRGERMFAFVDRFINTALPRTKDFRGIPLKSVDNMGNMTIGIKEHTIFPETTDEELKNIFGLSIVIVTKAKNKEEALEFFKFIGIPFARN